MMTLKQALAVACSAFALAASGVGPKTPCDVTVESDADTVLTPEPLWLGMGFNWSGYEGFCNPDRYFGDEAVELTEEQWSEIFRRVDFMRLRFIRMMTYSSGYLRGRDAAGEPLYVFREEKPNLYLRNVYRILDWAQAHDVLVFLGDWQMGTLNAGVGKEDPFAVRIQADFLEHLVKDKGYTCVKWWCSGNEEGVSRRPGILAAWLGLKAEIERRKLAVGLAGPDHYAPGERLEDLKLILGQHPTLLDAYENHYYEWNQPDAREREMIGQMDPEGRRKPWFAGEAAFPKSWNHTHSEAIENTACYTDHLQRRSSGVLHWMLDSSQYREHRPHGVWHITTGEVYPRFYPLALFCRLFWAPGADGKDGGEIIRCATSDENVSAAAIARHKQSGSDLTYVLVNKDAQRARRVLVREARAAASCDLALYCFHETGIARDEHGLPKPASIMRGVDLADGVVVELPPSSVVFLTTDDGGSPVQLARSLPEERE